MKLITVCIDRPVSQGGSIEVTFNSDNITAKQYYERYSDLRIETPKSIYEFSNVNRNPSLTGDSEVITAEGMTVS